MGRFLFSVEESAGKVEGLVEPALPNYDALDLKLQLKVL
jgi:hypothetical protein